jgi:hypothetical protein
VQGALKTATDNLEENQFLAYYSPLLEHEFKKNKKTFHWIKSYVAMHPNNDFFGECCLDNQPWPAGYELLRNYALSTGKPGIFWGVKQFIMFRRCTNHP